ncbi:kinase-like domain-containing protein [Phakopsora pachyrhizi]|nr:kinase-like domain-containing protein [Phakopsora pachyrhizi]
MLKNQLGLVGWSNLPDSFRDLVSIHKVGGSLTNAVFFVSCPINCPLNQQRSMTGEKNNHYPSKKTQTVLLRIYGPSSGSLISRKHELNLLHTLSTRYGIGPLLLGTFHNGRVEQYLRSRPLTKEEVREPWISCLIARKMRRLHSVDLSSVTFADDEPSGSPNDHHQTQIRGKNGFIRNEATQKIMDSTRASLNTVQSWSSSYSSDSDLLISDQSRALPGSLRSSQMIVSSPASMTCCEIPRMTQHTSCLSNPIRAKSLSRSSRTGAWQNVNRWQQEATKVLAEVTKLSEHINFKMTEDSSADLIKDFRSLPPLFPLSSAKSLVMHFRRLDVPRLILEMKAYKNWVHNYEKLNGKSPRVFSHNDTQCGNLLLLQGDEELISEKQDDQIAVIDFEYASPNPRGFDIANHFHEWCADYHHPTLSYSLTSHGPYPNLIERQRFYRSYLNLESFTTEDFSTDELMNLSKTNGASLNLDHKPLSVTSSLRLNGSKRDEILKTVERLEEEVNVWSPASHAMWALWGIVQARDDLKPMIERWTSTDCKDGEENVKTEEVEFDYLSYSFERVELFRQQIYELGVQIR